VVSGVNISNMQKFRLEETEIEEVGSFVCLGSEVWCQNAEEERKMQQVEPRKQMVYLFSCTLCEEISTYQKKLNYEYSIQM
jgi:hypothetical protein